MMTVEDTTHEWSEGPFDRARHDEDGDGPAASKLKPRPTDWRKLGPITDRELFDIIWKGGKALGKSKRMPAHRKKLTREEVAGLVRHVRALAASRH